LRRFEFLPDFTTSVGRIVVLSKKRNFSFVFLHLGADSSTIHARGIAPPRPREELKAKPRFFAGKTHRTQCNEIARKINHCSGLFILQLPIKA
jgi:hypothetical protein